MGAALVSTCLPALRSSQPEAQLRQSQDEHAEDELGERDDEAHAASLGFEDRPHKRDDRADDEPRPENQHEGEQRLVGAPDQHHARNHRDDAEHRRENARAVVAHDGLDDRDNPEDEQVDAGEDRQHEQRDVGPEDRDEPDHKGDDARGDQEAARGLRLAHHFGFCRHLADRPPGRGETASPGRGDGPY